MNKSMMERITEAKMYQIKALQALLPESVTEHMEVIGRELVAIFMECAKEMTEQDQGRAMEGGKESCHQGHGNGKQAKRVTIE
ncbi:MAG TPA: hypothetical protein GXX75_14105 [Clostridiales bacterium]|nr:hypothetical protein [Clostridiales bacterium]